MQNTEHLIIGASASAIACAQVLKESSPSCDVTTITDESDYPYFRPLIPYIINGRKNVDDITMLGSGPYKNKDINVFTNTSAVSVNPLQKLVQTTRGEFSYKKLLIATGSSPKIPDELKGINCKGVFALRRLSDAKMLAGMIKDIKEAVLLGGGLVNLKTAFALVECGIKVTLVVQSLEILSQLMEPEDAVMLRDVILNAGVRIITGRKAIGIKEKGDNVVAVILDEYQEIPCQVVCIGKGVSPNVDFLQGSGIELDGGVVVDRFTKTNLQDIYAAGDVAVTFNPITGQRITTALWTNAVEMGRCAGLNMLGYKTSYSGTFGIMNATQIGGIPFVSMGSVHTKDKDYEAHRHSTKTSYRKIVFSGNGSRLIGAIFIGDITNAGIYRYIIREGIDITKIKDLIIEHKVHYGHLIQTTQK